MNIDEEMKEMTEAINIESHIALQLNTLLCKCNVCNAIGNLYIFLTIFKVSYHFGKLLTVRLQGHIASKNLSLH